MRIREVFLGISWKFFWHISRFENLKSFTETCLTLLDSIFASCWEMFKIIHN